MRHVLLSLLAMAQGAFLSVCLSVGSVCRSCQSSHRLWRRRPTRATDRQIRPQPVHGCTIDTSLMLDSRHCALVAKHLRNHMSAADNLQT